MLSTYTETIVGMIFLHTHFIKLRFSPFSLIISQAEVVVNLPSIFSFQRGMFDPIFHLTFYIKISTIISSPTNLLKCSILQWFKCQHSLIFRVLLCIIGTLSTNGPKLMLIMSSLILLREIIIQVSYFL